MSDSKKIAKNTLFLYFRMFLIMGVTLYTSRVVLQQLGVSDFGIYSLVGGIVAMLGFFNAAMSSATQRYLSFDIGKGDFEKLQKTFSATLTIHILIAVLALVLAETIGLWYINYKMVFPQDRLYAVNVVYQFSVLTFLLNIIQVPYNSLILARERMSVYAYVSIFEATLKLIIVFLLTFGQDKLQLYAILTFVVAFIIRLIYQIYCRKKFEESKYHFEYDKVYLGELLSYSGWSLFGNFAAVARGQGVNMVLNLFYGTIVNAAYGITMQVQGAVQMFVSNFQLAFSPQIIKEYAQDNVKGMFKLINQSARMTYFLMLVFIVPIFLHIPEVLNLWLGDNVPELTILFIRYGVLAILIDSVSNPFMIAVQAHGNIKWYQIILGFFITLNLPISYLFVSKGYPIFTVFIVLLVITAISLVFRIVFINKLLGYKLSFFLKEVLLPILYVSVFVLLVGKLLFVCFLNADGFISLLCKVFTEFLITMCICIVVGTTSNEKKSLFNILKKRLSKR